MNDDDICLNLDAPSSHQSNNKRQKLSKPERLKQKKQQRKANSLNEKLATCSPAEVEPVPVKDVKQSASGTKSDRRKRLLNADKKTDDHDNPAKRFKFSSLFTSNPEIPKVESVVVQPVKEAVFADDNFASLPLHPYMISNLEKIGMTKMTSVQQQSIPLILEGQDVLIRSQTGSGKTLSYAVPIVENLQSITPKVNRSDGPYCIVIVPTRELALQSFETFQKLVRPFMYIVPGCIMGGERKKSEKARLRRGINILIATPGRLVDHITNTKSLLLNCVRFLVIDEADRLLDLGFERDVSTVVDTLGKLSQRPKTIMLSATLSAGVERLAGITMQNPVQVDISHMPSSGFKQTPDKAVSASDGNNTTEEFAMPDSLTHHFVIVPSKLRLITLVAFLLWKCKPGKQRAKVIVFLSTQDSVEFHFRLLHTCLHIKDEEGSPPELELYKLYGDMPQKERTKIFHDFHLANSGVLLCTDVAARGLDLPNVQWIVQYNTPGTPTDYIHRVGRTARIGVRGNALLFLTPAEVKYVGVLSTHKISMKELEVGIVLKTLLSCSLIHKGERARTAEECAAFLQAQFERHIHENEDLRLLARKAFQSFIRAYATYPSDLKHIFHIKNLHLGHVAKSFALGETPSKISELVGRRVAHVAQNDKLTKRQKGKMGSTGKSSTKPTRRPAHLDPMSEFASGLD